jgi:predicted alpha/beta-fold hydrolase
MDRALLVLTMTVLFGPCYSGRSAAQHPPARFQPASPFQTAVGLRSPHVQSIVGNFPLGLRRPHMRRQQWPIAGKDRLAVDVLSAPPSAPHLLVLHGLGGSPRSAYVTRVVAEAERRGWGVVAPELRGAPVSPDGRLRAYHVGATADVRATLVELRERVQGPIGIVGFSMGGNLVLKLIGELGADAPVRAAAAVSPPLDVRATVDHLDRPGQGTWLYRRGFLHVLRRPLLAAPSQLPGWLPRDAVTRPRSLAAFDDAVTAPLFGLADGRAYHAEASSQPWLRRIVRPTLVLASLDDPVIPLPAPTLAALDANPWLSPIITSEGGHYGFLTGSLLRPRSWSTEQVMTFLAAQLTP